jgi:hypothetical protein
VRIIQRGIILAVTSCELIFLRLYQLFSGPSGLFLDIKEDVREKWQPLRPLYGPPRWLTLQIHTDRGGLINGCSTESNKSAKCVYSRNLETITRSPPNFVYIDYKDPRKFHNTLYVALLSGTIPVIGSYNLHALPLSDLIEWDNTVVRIPPNQLNNMLDILDQLEGSQVMEMRRKGHFYFSNYFADPKSNFQLLK